MLSKLKSRINKYLARRRAMKAFLRPSQDVWLDLFQQNAPLTYKTFIKKSDR